uniref:actin-related protein 8-like isoform X2 n=1 Tax=Erigeron canadensis TaxID=72917 RepID=UPI001CB8C15A|nr:actin-related protein 8-like isoform X2 [Erigeron canadensis]
MSAASSSSMSNLLKKVWGSVSSRSSNNKSSSCNHHRHHEEEEEIKIMMKGGGGLGLGYFERIPNDIFLEKIIRLVDAKDVGMLTCVCKSWKLLLSTDNHLWAFFLQQLPLPLDLVHFSEIYLRHPPPTNTLQHHHRTYAPDDDSHNHQMLLELYQYSFMDIYRQRQQVPGTIIIDGGSGYCKFGWSKFDSPSGRSATFLEFGNIESPMYSRLRHFFSTIYARMQMKPSTQPIVVSIPICQYDDTEAAKAARKQLKEAIYSALFGINVPAVCAVSQATLALFAAKRTSGIVVNIGFHQTSVVPILHGKIMHKVGVEAVGVGALKLTGYLREQMQQRNLQFDSLYTVRSLKENLCYVALDYEAELCKDTEASYEVAAAGLFTLKKERFQTGEILFQPRIAGMRAMGLHHAVALCVDHCHAAELTADESWFKTIVLAGGTACLPGIADAAWYGAKIISNLSTFPNSWCITKKQFRSKAKRNHV